MSVTNKNDNNAEEKSHPYICNCCGKEYDIANCNPPSDATFYWVPSCPYCNAEMTENPPDKYTFEVKNNSLQNVVEDEETKEKIIQEVHAQARLYHGRLSGFTKEELIKIAQKFDENSETSFYFGPRLYRNIAFNVRRQARKM